MAISPEVYVIDDDEAIRHSLVFLLRSAGIASRTYDSAQAFLRVAGDLAPGCIVTDVRMPGMDGIELVRHLAEMRSKHRIVVMTGHGDVALAVEAMKAGAMDFLEKPFTDEAMLTAVRAGLSGDPRVAPDEEAKRRYLEVFANLSPREREVMHLVVTGKTNKVIAFELGISPRTVEAYRAGMMMKTQARTLSDLVRMALLADL